MSPAASTETTDVCAGGRRWGGGRLQPDSVSSFGDVILVIGLESKGSLNKLLDDLRKTLGGMHAAQGSPGAPGGSIVGISRVTRWRRQMKVVRGQHRGEEWGPRRAGVAPGPSGTRWGPWRCPSWALARPPPLQQSPCFCPDVTESTWSGKPAAGSMGPRRQTGGQAVDPGSVPQRPAQEAQGSPKQPAAQPSEPLLFTPVRNGEQLASLLLDSQHPPGDTERRCLRKVQTVPRLPPDGPEPSTLCLTLTPTKNQPPTSQVFPPNLRKASPDGKNGLSNYKSEPNSRLWPGREPERQQGGPGDARRSEDRASGALGWSPVQRSAPPHSEDPGDAVREPRTCRAEEGSPGRAGEPASATAEQVGDSGSRHVPGVGARTRAHARSVGSRAVLCLLHGGRLSCHSCSMVHQFRASCLFQRKLWTPPAVVPGQASPASLLEVRRP